MRTRSRRQQNNNVFYDCVKKPLIVYRFAGLLPIEGLLNPDGKDTRFVLKSLYNIFLVITLSFHCVCVILIYYCLLHTDKKILRDCSELIVVTTCVLLCISIFHFCKHWTPSLKKIESIEELLPPLQSRSILIHRMELFVGIMLFMSLAEHLAYNLYSITIVKNCFLLEDDSGWYFKSYFLASDYWFYHHIPFNYASGFVTQIIKLQAIILCHFADILIVVITAYLSGRFKNFYGNLVQKIKRRAGSSVPWLELQTQFTRLTNLVSTVDDLIGPIVFTTFLSHLLTICKHLYDVLQKKRVANMFQKTECVFNHSCDPVTVVFFSISLAALLFRSSMVSLMAAHLHTLSREPLNALHVVPTSVYNYEMQRFMDQVYYSKIGLSGLRFFYVTRGTVLSMISTILTYELVLLQIKE